VKRIEVTKLSEEELSRLRENLLAEISDLSRSIQEKRQRLASLVMRIRELKEKRRELVDEVRRLREERRRTKEQLLGVKEEIRSTYKEVREVRVSIRSKMRRARKLGRVVRRIKEPPEELEYKILELEWYQQTHSLSLEEEYKVIEKLSKLALLLQNLREYSSTLEAVEKEQKKLRELVDKVNDLKQQMTKLTNALKDLSSRIDEISSQISRIDAEIKSLREQIISTRKELDEALSKRRGLKDELRKVCDEIERRQLLKRAERIAKILAKRRELLREQALKAYEKYKRGERITFEEYKLLMEFNLLELK